MHTGGLTGSWSSSPCPEASSRLTKEKRRLALSAEQGRNREDPPNKWFWQLLATTPKAPLRASERGTAVPPSLSGASSWRQLHLVLPPSARHRESTASPGRQNLFAKVGSGARGSKANEAVSGKESSLYFQGLQLRGELPSKGWLHPHQSASRAFKDGGKGPKQKLRSQLWWSSWSWPSVLWSVSSWLF